MANTATKWRKRVAGWRASGETAEAYSARRGFTESSLRHWASRFGREDAFAGPVVRLAQLVRMPASPREEVPRGDWIAGCAGVVTVAASNPIRSRSPTASRALASRDHV